MKKITLRKPLDNNNPSSILKMVMGNSPSRPIGIEEMRRRVRVIDVLDQMGEGSVFYLEDSDHQTLLEGVTSFPWTQANRTLLNIIDDIQNAENVSFLTVVNNEAKEEAKEETHAAAE